MGQALMAKDEDDDDDKDEDDDDDGDDEEMRERMDIQPSSEHAILD